MFWKCPHKRSFCFREEKECNMEAEQAKVQNEGFKLYQVKTGSWCRQIDDCMITTLFDILPNIKSRYSTILVV